MSTAFGDIRTDSRVEGAAVAIVLPDGAALAEAPESAVAVVSARFAGPGWTVELVAPSGERLSARSVSPIASGARCRVVFDAGLVKVFPASG